MARLWPFSLSTPFSSLPASPLLPAPLPLPPTKDASEKDEGATLSVLNTLLEPFKGQDIPLAARSDPTLVQKQELPFTVSKIWQYVPFLASQGTSLTKAFVNHHLYGPPKPSWGVELTLFTSFLREAAAYSHLSSISRLRSVLDLGSLLPTPKDGIVTPISFRVKSRGLRGFLAEADAAETGKRQITGEWVINKRLWKRMQCEFAANKMVRKDRVILYLHGGAYYMMSAETHRFLTISVSRYTESRVFAVNYRLAPETRFPGQLHDAVSSYMRLIIDLKIPPENIVFVGDSAGGGLCLATMMYLRDEGYPLPSGAILMSPWVDLTMSCESWTTNAPFDYLPQPKADDHLNPVQCLLGEAGMKKYLCHPYVSPLFGDFGGLPPLLIQAGEAEVLRDEITLLAHKASLAGVPVEHEIFEDCVHVFQAFLFLEASRRALQSQRQFVKVKLPTLATPKVLDVANMDAEIRSDAHKVDQQGIAEPTSLPASPTPSATNLPLEEEEEEDTDEDRFSDSSSTQAQKPTPPLDPSPSGPRDDFTPSHSSAPSTPRLSGTTTPRLSGTSTPPLLRNSAAKRPILRTYVSKDLLMTSNPASPVRKTHGRHQSTHFESREVDPALHIRSSSHPDLRLLLEQYEAEGPAHTTRLYSVQDD